MERRDTPITRLKDDEFCIESYIHSICEFIRSCETPVTLSLQGEWGSGKSSIMRIIENELCGSHINESERFGSIWLNTWELFLENDHDEAVKKLSLELLSQIENHFDKLKKKKDAEKFKNELLQYMKALSNTLLSVSKLKSDFSDRLISKTFDKSQNESVREKKAWFEKFISGVVEEKGNGVTDKAFLVFVDDLDRISPRMAITLLEALKNFFDIKHCIFIIAIDYEVVERGIEQKYGDLKITNRNISKDFFDKLVQLPYVVPMCHYNIKGMVMSRLKEIGFFRLDYEYRKYEDTLLNIVTLATNKNPRSIKRLMNMVQLMLITEQGIQLEYLPDLRVIELLLLSIQLAFPSIYELLLHNNDFTEWKKSLYVKSDSVTVPQEVKEKLGLDTEWKEIIYLAASNDSHMKNNYTRISKLLETYEEFMLRCEKENKRVREILGVISMVGISNVNSLNYTFDGAQYNDSSQTQFSQGNRLIESIDFSVHEHVLDVGCGNGKTTIEMWRKNRNMVIDAFDYSTSQIEVALKNYEKYVSRNECDEAKGYIRFYQMDALELNEDSKYDLIFSNATLHWITNANKMYSAIYKALKPGGRLAVHQGGKGSYKGLHAIVRKAIVNLGFEAYYRNWEFPAFYPEKKEMEQLLDSISFKNIRVESFETDGREYANLIENFEKASLIFYKERLKSEEEYQSLIQEYYRIAGSGPVDKYTHRLYIYAEK